MAAMPAISWTNEDHQNPPRIVRHAIWLLFFEVRDDSEPMPFKSGRHFDHVDPARIASDRALAPFVRHEDLLPTKIRHEQCKCRVERVGNCQVKWLHTQVEMVGPAPDAHELGLGYATYSRDYTLLPPCHLLLAIRRRSSNRLAPVREESVHRLGERLKIVSPVCRSCTGMDIKLKSCPVDLWQMRMRKSQYEVAMRVEMSSATENAQQCRSSSAIHCKFIAQIKRA
jgi:hypothetical protein